jgi:hemerythrin
MSLEWKDSYKIGHDEIDDQHLKLFGMINDLLAARGTAAMTDSAVKLSDFTIWHFSNEEKLMKSIAYPEMDSHVAQHQSLLSRLTEISDRIANGTIDRLVLEAFLTDWLLKHIASTDSKLAIYVHLNAE